MRKLILLILSLFALNGHAESAIQHVVYRDNAVTSLHGITLTSTQVVFGDDEAVLDVQGGDSAGWMVTLPPNLPNMVFVKPTVFGSDSNLIVVTNKHHYYFHVTSNHSLDDQSPRTYALRFVYPEQAKQQKLAEIKSRESRPKSYNWSYSFSGHPALKPLHAFDDGTFTYLELPKGQPVPAVFAVDNKQGKESVVNTRQQGDFLVILRTAPQFTLRNGQKAVATVFNQAAIQSIRQGRNPS